MKKITTFFTSFLISIVLTAQINTSQSTNAIMQKSINNKIIMSGDEALSHLIVNPNPTTTSVTSNLKSITGIGSETIIGTTTYDLQSNAAVQNRIVMHEDGTISAGWTISQQYSSTFLDRGTGYNFFDGTDWGTMPSNRIEGSRGGWPSIITMGSGSDVKEASMTHNTDNSYINMTHRPVIGQGNWTESIVSTMNDSSGVYRYMIWNRSAVGGLDNNTIHMIAVTASTAFNGTPFNGLDGALLYYRSRDGGNTWDQQDIQLPSLDSSMFISMSGDVYAMDAQGENVVIAYFDDWGDSFILKSTDNGDNWERTNFLDFPVTKYVTDSGFDLDNNDTTDHVYSTDGYGSVILDAQNQAHVFYGVLQYSDDDLTDGGSSWYPGTNMLAYWNESFGADYSDSTLKDTIGFIDAAGIVTPRGRWWSEMMDAHIIAQAPDLNGDSIVDGVDSTGGYALYYASRASMPNAGIAANGDIYVSFSGYTETADDGTQVYRHIYVTKSSDGGLTWRKPIDVTPCDDWGGMQECVFGSMNKVVDDKIRIIYQKDFFPGLAVRGDEDLIDFNDIVYLEIDTVDLFDGSFTIPAGLNENNINNIDLFPNPANDITTIQISSISNEIIKINIVDLLGKKVYADEIIAKSGLNLKHINVSSFKNGVYFVNSKIGDQVVSKKLVITK